MSRETVEQVSQYKIADGIPDRNIRRETCELFGVRAAVSHLDGKTATAYYYPIYKNGVVVGYKKKDLTKSKKDRGHFTIVGDVSASSEFFGSNVVSNDGKKLHIVEGENDTLALYQALSDDIRGTKWENLVKPSVVSLVAGTAGAEQNVAENLDICDRFEKVVLVFDNDRASIAERKRGVKKGYEATADVSLLLGPKRCEYVELPLNDPCEMLKAGRGTELAKLATFKHRVFTPEEIKMGGDTELNELLSPLEEGIRVDCFPILMDKLHGLRPGEMTILLAPTKSGKSSVCREMGFEIVKNGGFVGHLFLEESIKKTKQAYLALDNNVRLPVLREDPSVISREAAEKTYNEIIDNGRTIYLDAGIMSPETVLRNMRYMAAMGAKYIILDHLSYVFGGDKSMDERRAIDNMLTELAAFKKAANIHLIVVAHIKRKDFQPKKSSQGDTVYPYWIPVNKEDGRSSGAFEQICDNLITIEPEVLNEGGERGRVRLKVAANREWDDTGIADIVTMDNRTGRFVSAADIVNF